MDPSAPSNGVVESFTISKTWDDKTVDHEEQRVTLERDPASDFLLMKVEGPLFNDPPAPDAQPGPTDRLYDYEVIEAFFLNEQDSTYLEVELGPHGHHLVLLLDGPRNIIKLMLPLTYKANIDSSTHRWSGTAKIPLSYFPPKVTKFNAFAIHGSSPNIQYEELYPQIEPKTQPDFHRLQDFRSIDFSKFISDNKSREYSGLWMEARTNPNASSTNPSV